MRDLRSEKNTGGTIMLEGSHVSLSNSGSYKTFLYCSLHGNGSLVKQRVDKYRNGNWRLFVKDHVIFSVLSTN